MKKSRLPFLMLFGLFFILSATGVWKTVYLNADIDESYALTMAGRIVSGDKLFVTMWEPHQLSALLYAPFLWVYKSIYGNFVGALIFMRWIGVFLQLFVSVYMYFVLKNDFGTCKTLMLATLYFNFTPKHIQSPEFTSLCYWFLMLLILSLIQYKKHERRKYIVMAGISISAMVLCYPAMVLVFMVCGVWLALKKDYKGIVYLIISCVLLGLTCVLYLCVQAGGLQAVLSNISNVLSDASHAQNKWITLKYHVVVLWQMSKILLPTMIILQVGRPILDKKNKYAVWILAVASCVQCAWAVGQFHTIVKVNFLLFYPIVFQFFMLGFYASEWYVHETEKKEFFRIAAMVNITALLAILFSSNLDANYSVAFLMPAALFGLAMLLDVNGISKEVDVENQKFVSVALEKNRSTSKLATAVIWFVVIIFVIQLFATRILLVRYTSTQRYNIFAGYYETHVGSLKGVSLSALDYQQYEAKYNALQTQLKEDDVFLYVGCDMFLYTCLNGTKIGTGNTISTPAFSEQLVHYYELHPERIPTVVFVDREYGADFRVVLTESPFKEFMEAYFDLDNPICDGPLDVYRRNR